MFIKYFLTILCTHYGGVTSYLTEFIIILLPLYLPALLGSVVIFIQVPPFSLGVTMHPELGDLTCPRRAHARRRIVRVFD